MSKMRTILRTLMDQAGHNAHDVFRQTGVQPSTIYRYFNNVRGDLKPETVKKIARIYGVTESQLRGDVPIDGMEMPQEQLSLKELLTLEEYRLFKNVKHMDNGNRELLYRLAEVLSDQTSAYCPDYDRRRTGERRQGEMYPNAQLRITDEVYNSPPVKKRLRHPDENYGSGRSKNSQTA